MTVKRKLELAMNALYDISDPNCDDWPSCWNPRSRKRQCPPCEAKKVLKKIDPNKDFLFEGIRGII